MLSMKYKIISEERAFRRHIFSLEAATFEQPTLPERQGQVFLSRRISRRRDEPVRRRGRAGRLSICTPDYQRMKRKWVVLVIKIPGKGAPCAGAECRIEVFIWATRK